MQTHVNCLFTSIAALIPTHMCTAFAADIISKLFCEQMKNNSYTPVVVGIRQINQQCVSKCVLRIRHVRRRAKLRMPTRQPASQAGGVCWCVYVV